MTIAKTVKAAIKILFLGCRKDFNAMHNMLFKVSILFLNFLSLFLTYGGFTVSVLFSATKLRNSYIIGVNRLSKVETIRLKYQTDCPKYQTDCPWGWFQTVFLVLLSVFLQKYKRT